MNPVTDLILEFTTMGIKWVESCVVCKHMDTHGLFHFLSSFECCIECDCNEWG